MLQAECSLPWPRYGGDYDTVRLPCACVLFWIVAFPNLISTIRWPLEIQKGTDGHRLESLNHRVDMEGTQNRSQLATRAVCVHYKSHIKVARPCLSLITCIRKTILTQAPRPDESPYPLWNVAAGDVCWCCVFVLCVVASDW
jgi:hypothetical protein